MTLILNMATGDEYQGLELSCPRAVVTAPARADSLPQPALQLQLATAEATPTQQKSSIDMAGIDIDTLIQSIAD